jgi:hypothetical protein
MNIWRMRGESRESGSPAQIRLQLLAVFLFVLAGMEARIALRDYVMPWSKAIYGVRLEPAWERAGRLSVWVGSAGTDFFAYLRSVVPPDASLLVPGEYQDPWNRFPNLLQYYLYPRTIIACPHNDLLGCIDAMSDEGQIFILKSEIANWEIPKVLNAAGYLREDGQGVYRVP